MTNEEAVFCIFLMRFNLQPIESVTIVKNWLNEHPAETWASLKKLLSEDQITITHGRLKKVFQQTPAEHKQPVTKYRGVEISKINVETVNVEQTPPKKLRYRGQEYRS